jgi:dTDP-4-amino-4,6-dideoxygalactose transaminase
MPTALALFGGSQTRKRPFPAWPVCGKPEELAVLRVLRSGRWCSVGGSAVARFENAFAEYQEAKHAIAVCNGTVALRLALLATGIRAGDEVIVPPYTFLATASAVVEANAIPVFVDIDPDTYNLDPDLIEAAITPRTRAIIPVHFAGLPADMKRIHALARRRRLAVIEDAAHAHGATLGGRKVGALGDMGCFSFQMSKNLTAGEGGIILTNDDNLAEMCRALHNCGRPTGGVWYEHHYPGGNYRLPELSGALLLAQLSRLERQTERRNANGLYLDARLAEIPGIRPMARDTANVRHAYHLYMFRYDAAEFGGVPRARFLEALMAEGVPASAGYAVPLYRQPLFTRKTFGPFTGGMETHPELDYARVSCPVCERACSSEACWLTQSLLLGSRRDMEDIVRAVTRIYQQRASLTGRQRAR